MNYIIGIASTFIISAGIITLIGSTTGPPKCKDGFVPSFQMPVVGWVCLAGYKP